MKTIDKDERLLPLPGATDLQLAAQDIQTNYSPFYDEDLAQGRSLREYFLVVYKRLPLILAMTILITAGVAFYMYKQPSVYESVTTMIIEPPKPKLQANQGVNINFGNDMNYYNTQLRLLKNIDLMRKVIIRLGLYKDPNLLNQGNKGFLDTLKSAVSGNKASETKENSLPTINDTSNSGVNINIIPDNLTPEEKQRADMYAGALVGWLDVVQVPSTNLVNIKITSNYPELAPKVADMVATVFIADDTERAVKGSVDNYKDLSKSIEELKGSIAEQEQQRLSQMQVNNLPLTTGTDKGGDINSERLSTLSGQYLAAQDERRKAQAEYEAAVEANNKGVFWGTVADKGYLSDARSNIDKMKSDLQKRIDDLDKQIQDAESKKSQLLVKYQDEYYLVKEVNAQLEKFKAARTKVEKDGNQRIARESTNLETNAQKEVMTGLRAQLTAAQRREEELRGAYNNATGVANKMGIATIQLTTLNSTIDTNRSLLNTYIQRQKELELLISSSKPENLQISTTAQPGILVGPQRNRNVFIAFFLSLGIGIGLAFLLDYLDDSIKNSDDVGKYLGLATLALIPHQSIVGKKKRGAIIAGKGSAVSSTALASIEDTRSAMAEAYRHLRTSLLFSSAGKPPQTILITSSQPSEGKTTTAINTAVTLAQAGADVVIIDCDLRRPRLHSHFSMENTTGLTNYLSGERNTEHLMKPYPDLPNLKVITSGPIPPNPTELLSSTDMKNLLQYLKGNFNHIIIDSPPAISFTDAAIIATLVDGVVMVAMAGKSSIHLIRRFKQRLNSIGVRIFGVVLNGLKPDSFEYGYYGYGYNYSYDYEDDGTTPRMEDEPKVKSKVESAKN